MARRKPPQPPPLVQRDLTPEEIDRGITKLNRRINQVENLRGSQYNAQAVYDAESEIRNTLLGIFGEESLEFREHGYHKIRHGSNFMGMSKQESQKNFEVGIPRTVGMLQGLIRRLNERKSDLAHDPVARAKNSIEGLDLHPRIGPVAVPLYIDGHFSEAVFNATKALANYIQEKSGRFDLDGTALMSTVFSKRNPILAFSDLSDQSGQDEQEGMMHLFMGASLGIRNPRGHSMVSDSAERAIEYIAFLSMLASRVDEASKR